MESVPVERIPLSPPRLRTLNLSDRTLGDAHGIRSHGERIPLSPPLLRTLSPVRPHSGRGTKEKTVPEDGLFMSALCARSIARPAGRASIFVLVDFPSRGIGKIKRGFRTLRSPTQGSALRTRGLSRKAGESFSSPAGGTGCAASRSLRAGFRPLLTSWEPEPRCRPYTALAPSGW